MKSAKRFPILLWGDLVEGGSPVLRRALAGFRAHECMYAWVYLTEHLAHRRLLEVLPAMSADERGELLGALDAGIWRQRDRFALDPHYQLGKAAFESVAHMACLAAQSGESRPVFVELGSTFFTCRTKFQIIDRLAAERFADWPQLRPEWIGIDNSRFMHDTTRLLHPGDAIELIEDYRALTRPERFAVFLSRFVASYAFASSGDFAGYLADRFQAALVEDAYSTTGQDVNVFNHGQAETFFSLPEVLGRLERAGFEIYLLDTHPDFPAGAAPCHVVRYLAAKRGVLTERSRDYLAGLGLNRPDKPVSPATLLDDLNASMSPREWRSVEKAKRESPVWGRAAPASSLLQSCKDTIKRYLARPGWRRYRLGGPLATREIDRALSEEKP